MALNLVATLAILLQTKSVSATARRLGVSQPTVSRSLAQLREVLADPLLIRIGNTMARTPRGDQLVDPVNDWLMSAEALFNQPQFDPATLQRRFRVASTDFGVLAVVGPALPGILILAPGLAIDIVPLPSDITAALASGAIDLAVSGLDHDPVQVHSRALFEDDFACVMWADHPAAITNAPSMPIDEFLGYSHLGTVIGGDGFDRVASSLGNLAVERRLVATLPYFYAAPDVLANSDLVMTMPTRAAIRLCAASQLAWRPAPVELGTLDYRLLWHERSARDPATSWLGDRLAAASGHSPAA